MGTDREAGRGRGLPPLKSFYPFLLLRHFLLVIGRVSETKLNFVVFYGPSGRIAGGLHAAAAALLH